MKILELFAGSRSFSKVAEEMGMETFTSDYKDFENDMSNWVINKKIKWRETIVEGIENSPQAFLDLLNGKNIGKMLVKI